jgi:WD40 repeat protein
MRRRIDSDNNHVAITPNGRLVASGGADATVKVWNLSASFTAGLSKGP